MLQSAEEKYETIMESLEEKKEIPFAHPRKSNRIAEKSKEKPKVVEAKQGEKHDARTVNFSEKCVESMSLSNAKKEKRKLRHSKLF